MCCEKSTAGAGSAGVWPAWISAQSRVQLAWSRTISRRFSLMPEWNAVTTVSNACAESLPSPPLGPVVHASSARAESISPAFMGASC